LTFREIEQDGFEIDRKVEMLTSSDSSVGVAKSMGLGMIGFADALSELRPDLMVVLGDRYEIFAAVAAAMVARIPVAHLHGGEATEGLIDEAIRHSITKMSHLHFVAAEEYRKRVIQLGEQPDAVHLVGGLGVENIRRLELMSREELESSLGLEFGKRNLLVTFHPVTLEDATAEVQMTALLQALEVLQETRIIFTLPNADSGGRVLIEMVNAFVERHPDSYAFTSLGYRRYLSCLAYVDGVVGNSSSGLTEVPSFRKATVNIGDRQRGRLQSASVINCAPVKEEIVQAINRIYSDEFVQILKGAVNPYGDGRVSDRVVEVLKTVSLDNLLKKTFFDVSVT
jgi:GDP/UDP-N,N'-diacetylbacillosamine 2-epimerase (hydrolysing)